MKLTTLIFLIGCLHLSARTFSQTVSLSGRNMSLPAVFAEVKKQTGFLVVSSYQLLGKEKPVTVNAVNQPVEDFIKEILKDRQLSYTILDKTISIRKKPAFFAEPDRVADLTKLPPLHIRGQVTNENGQPLIGVTVALKGTQVATNTNTDGEFEIKTAQSGSQLVFSSIGFETQSVDITGRNNLVIVMKTRVSDLGGVVVIGYGTQRKVDVTSAVASIQSKDFVQGVAKDAGQLLQGKVAGLTIVSPSGDPTKNSQILLRGTATLNTSTQPLILVDGIPGDLNTVAPQDIESIDVLKDGSAAAIYGTRGTNGVILITTKNTKGNVDPSIEYSGILSTQRIARKPQMLTAADYRKLLQEGVAGEDEGADTDWLKAISQNPLIHTHNFTIRGGTAKTNYVASGTYRSLEGIFQKTDNRTLNSRVDINHNMFGGKVLMNAGLLTRNNSYTSTGNGVSFAGHIYRQALNRNPTAPLQNDDGTWNEKPAVYQYENPLSRLYESDGKHTNILTRANGSIAWYALPSLRLKVLGAVETFNQNEGYSETKKHISTIRGGKNGYAIIRSDKGSNKLLEMTAEYTQRVQQHRFTALGGYSYQENSDEGSWMENWDFPTDKFSYNNIGLGDAIKLGRAQMGSNKYESNLIGFFARATYSFDDKYLLMASLRREASSKFLGAKQPWGNFPSVSVGWRINEEGFMQDISFIDNLKLRVGYGVTGTAPDALFLGIARLGYGSYTLVDGRWVRSLSPSSNPNEFLRWEEKRETNAGLDFSLYKGRISGSIDYYKRLTKGLLFDYPVPSPPNLFSTTTANAGTMENKGIEMLVNLVPVQKKDFTWTTSVNFSTNKNKLVSLENELYKLTNDFFDAGRESGEPFNAQTHRVQVGNRIGNFYGFKVIDVTDDGKWIYETTDGKAVPYDEFEYKDEDKRILGNGLPKYYTGWNNTFRYKNIDLGITMRGAFGFQILNFQRMYFENPGTTQYNRLKSSNDPVFGKAVLNKTVSREYNSYYVEDGDYWKIDNITLGYNFTIRAIKAQNARVYISTLNSVILTGYKGIDPEVNSLGLSPGNDERDKYPSVRTFTIGLNIKFN
ncbi:SusC/RagA family TonB-linked outer membrane protein [Chitinophaga sp. MM2321]|uniref:SusC/RagA family TonB-linked outer membrane protein n=1 Tax=Chitinophaga sp. MM2321 TaxID=3137178 RepID=UPI0032D59C7A